VSHLTSTVKVLARGKGTMTDRPRVVWLRSGEDGRYLSAYLHSDGRLQLDGEDFGPKIRIVTSQDSYEYVADDRSGGRPEAVRAARRPSR
jgi:hypothetical protein